MTSVRAPYRTLMISGIPVEEIEDVVKTKALWAVDVNANAAAVTRIHLVCPVHAGQRDNAFVALDPNIDVTDASRLSTSALEKLVECTDVVEVPGNPTWSMSALSRRAVRLARQHNKVSILGISSNRPKTTVMNAAGTGLQRQVRAVLRACSIRLSQIYLARACDAVRLVGSGLRPLVEGHAKEIRIEVASWIKREDIKPARAHVSDVPRMAIASRLEPMKGVRMGLAAAADAMQGLKNAELVVIGVGEEEARMRQEVHDRGIEPRTRFLGQLAYPDAFFEVIENVDYVFLTNLNDEQPRLIFDAIACGAIPICPRNPAYTDLGLDSHIFYDQGSAQSLKETFLKLTALKENERRVLQERLRDVAMSRTIESMHAARSAWVTELVARKSCQAVPSARARGWNRRGRG